MGGLKILHDNSLASRFADEISECLKKHFGYKVNCAHSMPNDTITAHRAKMDLYFRFPNGYYRWNKQNDTLVIARIEFQEQRAGHGTWLLATLVRLASKYGYTQVGIECISKSEGIQNFVRKFGFVPVSPTDNDPRDLVVSVAELKSRISHLGILS